ncbi:MAG TPA: AAA family ATPase [Bacteroidia bacterium]|jgi:predicted ATP-dependent endonuclease of OLD family|nr:AAA family ATPase [Bacteroidia bacterium]
MALLKTISIQNFKCYRKQQVFNLSQSNFFIGTNNAGKSAVLKAIHCFFDDNQYFSEFINKTELRSKGSGANKTVISITFDFNAITTKLLRGRLVTYYGADTVTIFKNFTFRESTNKILVDYTINDMTLTYEELPVDILDL